MSQARLIFKVARNTDETAGVWLFEDPFVFSTFFFFFQRTFQRLKCGSLRERARLNKRAVVEAGVDLPQSIRTTGRGWRIQFILSARHFTGRRSAAVIYNPSPGHIRRRGAKEVHHICVKVLNLRSLAGFEGVELH